MENHETILQITGISKRYPGVRALDGVNLEVRRGEVLSLVGENGAGKSTLMKILLGETAPSAGTMTFKGKPHAPKSPHDALVRGISMIHQELSLVPHTSVAENIWIGREERFTRGGLICSKLRTRMTEELLREYEIDINPNVTVATLTVAKQQLVEIARAISYKSDIIIMDEPTSSLTSKEIALLIRIIHKLTEQGTAIIFISHKLDEVLELSDRISVLRDGQSMGTYPASEVDHDKLIRLIVGREVNNMFSKLPSEFGEVVLDVRGLTRRGYFRDCSFHVHRGEIVGFSGLVGAGRTELLRAVFGVDSYDSGEIWMDGKKVRIRNTGDAIAHGMGMVTEDRRGMGIFPILSVRINVGIAAMKKFLRFGFFRRKEEARLTNDMIRKMEIKVSSPQQTIGTLSGGNQQKALIGRWLLNDTRVLIMDEPTRGIDVGSKSEIHRQVSELAQSGMAVVLISSELPECMGMSDRIYVMQEGRIVKEFNREQFDQERLMNAAFGLSVN